MGFVLMVACSGPRLWEYMAVHVIEAGSCWISGDGPCREFKEQHLRFFSGHEMGMGSSTSARRDSGVQNAPSNGRIVKALRAPGETVVQSGGILRTFNNNWSFVHQHPFPISEFVLAARLGNSRVTIQPETPPT